MLNVITLILFYYVKHFIAYRIIVDKFSLICNGERMYVVTSRKEEINRFFISYFYIYSIFILIFYFYLYFIFVFYISIYSCISSIFIAKDANKYIF